MCFIFTYWYLNFYLHINVKNPSEKTQRICDSNYVSNNYVHEDVNMTNFLLEYEVNNTKTLVIDVFKT